MKTNYNKENIKKTLDMVKKNGEEHFDMIFYFVSSEEQNLIELEEADNVDISSCGTTACIAGNAALAMFQDGIEDTSLRSIMGWIGSPTNYDIEGMEPMFSVFRWSRLGDLGNRAVKMAIDEGQYKAAIFLMEEIIKQGNATV